MKIAVSFLKSNLSNKETIKKIETTDADYIHVDLMDGKFVKNKSYTVSELKNLVGNTTKKLDIHLMTKNPLKYVDELATLNIEYLTFHYEAVENAYETINHIKDFGLKCGMAIKPKTNIKKIKDLLPLLDLILVMSVEPGKGGQEFMMNQLLKIEELKNLKKDYNYVIAVDGGVNEENIDAIKNAGADLIISGSFVTMADDYQNQIDKLR